MKFSTETGVTMTVALQLTAETAQLIAEASARKGQSPETYLRQLVEKDASGNSVAPDRLGEGLRWLTTRRTEEVQAARERIFAASPPPREIRAGKTVLDVVEGTWPGTETDAEIREALDRMS